MQRANTITAAAKPRAELTSRSGFPLAMQNASVKSGITAKRDGSDDDKMSSSLKAILAQAECQWGGAPCEFYTRRANYIASQQAGQRTYKIP